MYIDLRNSEFRLTHQDLNHIKAELSKLKQTNPEGLSEVSLFERILFEDLMPNITTIPENRRES